MPDRAAVPRAEVPVGGGQPAQPGMGGPAHIDRLQYPWLPLVAWLVAQNMFWPLRGHAQLPPWFPVDESVAVAAEHVARCLLSGQPLQLQEAMIRLAVAIDEMARAHAAKAVAQAEQRAAAAELRAATAEQRVAAANEAAAAVQLQAAALVAGAELQAAAAGQRTAVAERRAADAEAAAAQARFDAATHNVRLAVEQEDARDARLLASNEASVRQHFQRIVLGRRIAEAAQAADIAALGPPVPDRQQH